VVVRSGWWKRRGERKEKKGKVAGEPAVAGEPSGGASAREKPLCRCRRTIERKEKGSGENGG
jgi:hypothetical protein